MANNPCNTELFDKAARFAITAHAGTERRGKGFPYIIHCMEAASIVATISNDPELLSAAILHDVVEDTDYTEEDIRREFGDRVAELVMGESDIEFDESVMSKDDAWRYRKQVAISQLRNASLDEKIVTLGDKLSNMRAIARDSAIEGDRFWNMFRIKNPVLHKWRYEALADALSDLEGTAAYEEFKALVHQVFDRY